MFGEGDDRYDILKSEILSAKDSILVDLPLYEIARRYKRRREAALPVLRPAKGEGQSKTTRPKVLVGKKVKSRDGDFVGHVVAESDKNMLVLGHYHYRFDVPKSKIWQVDKDIILNHRYETMFKYCKPKNSSLRRVSTVAGK